MKAGTQLNAKVVFFLGVVLCATGALSPPLALSMGLVFAFCFGHPYALGARSWSKLLLQVSVVGLGFGMNLHDVLHAGRAGFVYTTASIALTLIVGLLLGWLLRVRNTCSFLITIGTAVCGGSAIAAVGPILEADQEEMAMSIGTIFLFNSVALLTFPPLGGLLHLPPKQFGLWSALAIHDTSSVVGATARYAVPALVVGTTVKLARALWIIPISIGAAAVKRSRAQVHLPWFILCFCLAAVANTYLPFLADLTCSLNRLGRLGLTVTLYLIGSGLSKRE